MMVFILLSCSISGCYGNSTNKQVEEETSNSEDLISESSIPNNSNPQICLTAPTFEIKTLNRTNIEDIHTDESGNFNLSEHLGKTIILDFTAVDFTNREYIHQKLKVIKNNVSSSVLIVSIGVWGESLEYIDSSFGKGSSELPWIVGVPGSIRENLTYFYGLSSLLLPSVVVIDKLGYVIDKLYSVNGNWSKLEEAVNISDNNENTKYLRQQYYPSAPYPPCHIKNIDYDDDGIDDDFDTDIDGDGWLNSKEQICKTDPIDEKSIPIDTDGDGLCDDWDDWDNDNDSFNNNIDDCPLIAGSSYIPLGCSPDSDSDGVSDPFERTQYGTDIYEWDTDGDGFGDGEEIENGTNPLDSENYPIIESNGHCIDLDEDNIPNNPNEGLLGDPDNDGLTNYQEYILGTNCTNWDSDGDGLNDGWEYNYLLNPLSFDSKDEDLDNDGLTNIQEHSNNTNPLSNDTDNDGLNDSFEISWIEALNGSTLHDTDNDGFRDGPCDWDTDGDGMSDFYETIYINILNPMDPFDRYYDFDEDGLTNFEESLINTNPNDNDTDGDGMPDGWELVNGLNATSILTPNGANDDPDADGLTNLEEFNVRDLNGDGIIEGMSTDPLIFDSDEDGLGDGWEVANGTDPTAADSDGDGVDDGTDEYPLNPNQS